MTIIIKIRKEYEYIAVHKTFVLSNSKTILIFLTDLRQNVICLQITIENLKRHIYLGIDQILAELIQSWRRNITF
jgi:hypothetical protein